jgi:hypothetical protein
MTVAGSRQEDWADAWAVAASARARAAENVVREEGAL